MGGVRGVGGLSEIAWSLLAGCICNRKKSRVTEKVAGVVDSCGVLGRCTWGVSLLVNASVVGSCAFRSLSFFQKSSP